MRFFPWTNLNPLSLSPALWIDISDTATRFDATSGGSLVTSNGADVKRVEDKSGNARHITQGSAGKFPTLVVGAKNGRDVLNFDGTDDFMASVAFGGSETWTRWVVFASMASQTKVVVAHASAYNTPNGADAIVLEALKLSSLQDGAAASVSSKLSVGNVAGVGTYILASQQCDGTNAGQTLRINGVAVSVTNPNAGEPGTFTKASTTYGVGAYNGGSAPANCRIAEIFHVPGVVAAVQREAMDRLLMSKWAIT